MQRTTYINGEELKMWALKVHSTLIYWLLREIEGWWKIKTRNKHWGYRYFLHKMSFITKCSTCNIMMLIVLMKIYFYSFFSRFISSLCVITLTWGASSRSLRSDFGPPWRESRLSRLPSRYVIWSILLLYYTMNKPTIFSSYLVKLLSANLGAQLY